MQQMRPPPPTDSQDFRMPRSASMVPQKPPSILVTWAAILVSPMLRAVGGAYALSKDGVAQNDKLWEARLGTIAAGVQSNATANDKNAKAVDRLIVALGDSKDRQAENTKNVAVMASKMSDLKDMLEAEHRRNSRRRLK